MSTAKPSSQFFGLDLSALWPEVRRAWQGVHQWPMLAWLTPQAPVRVLHADGRETTWLGGRMINTAQAGAQRFEAIELPDHLLLRRTLSVPAMAQPQVAQAIELDVRSASPFAPFDLVWGYSSRPADQGELSIHAVMASRKQVERYLASQQARLAPDAGETGHGHEVWAFTPVGTPIILPGWSESRRFQYGAQRRRRAYALLAVALGLAAVMAATPTMQLRLRAIEAVHAFEALHLRTAELAAQRETYMRAVAQLEDLRGLLAERAQPLSLLEVLTRTLPDDTSLQSLEVQGIKVTLSGLTGNAATLMQLLGATEGFREVRATSPATRSPGADAENFIVELQLDSTVFSMAAPAPGALRPAATTANAAAASVVVQDSAASSGVAAPGAVPASSVAAGAGAGIGAGTGAAPPRRKSRFSSGPEDKPAAAAPPTPAPAPAPSTSAATRKTAP